MGDVNFNLKGLRGHTFKGFVQFQDGMDWFRLKERQTMSINFSFDRAKHYSDDGLLFVDPAGISHSFQMTVKATSDMFDDSFDLVTPITGMDTKTISYWIAKNAVHEPVEIVFVSTLETLIGPAGSTNEKFINLKFLLDPNQFTTGLGANGGSPDVQISGNILRITEVIRDTTGSQ